MISCFLREQQRYTQGELARLLKLSDEALVPILRTLKALGVVKAIRVVGTPKDLTELSDEDVDVSDVCIGDEAHYYVFTFVGILVVSGRVLKCYPKYIRATPEPVEALKQVLRVLEKYQRDTGQRVTLFGDQAEIGRFNLLGLLFFLHQDYFEHGLYTNTQNLIEDNGRGAILWERTINTTTPFYSHEQPYYLDTKTKRHIIDNASLITRLHKAVLTEVSRQLRDADLLTFFDLTEVELTEETVENLGTNESLVYLLESELRSEFNTRKQRVLQSLIAYLTHAPLVNADNDVLFFGTTCFYHVWEVVCARTLDNQLQRPLRELTLPRALDPSYSPQAKLIDLIEKPLWSETGETANGTLIPDIISLSGMKFVIIDAKYYTPKLEWGQAPVGQPGIESISKQYLYQLAYQSFIQQHGFEAIRNCFVMPTECSTVEKRGNVELNMFKQLGLAPIQIRFLPAHWVYTLYLNEQTIALADLDL